jgi:hypothetical protein
MEQIRLPKFRVPIAERDISLHYIAARWRKPVWFVRHQLLMAGVPLRDVPQPPVEGVSGKDLLEFEQRLRQGEEATA